MMQQFVVCSHVATYAYMNVYILSRCTMFTCEISNRTVVRQCTIRMFVAILPGADRGGGSATNILNLLYAGTPFQFLLLYVQQLIPRGIVSPSDLIETCHLSFAAVLDRVPRFDQQHVEDYFHFLLHSTVDSERHRISFRFNRNMAPFFCCCS